MTRFETIVALLKRYSDLVDPQQVRGGGDTFGAALMPATYNASVKELERLLRRMRDQGGEVVVVKHPNAKTVTRISLRGLWWHLNARYIAAVPVVRTYQVPMLDKHGRRRHRKDGSLVLTPEYRSETLPDGASDLMVAAGVEWLVANWAERYQDDHGVWHLAEPKLPPAKIRERLVA